MKNVPESFKWERNHCVKRVNFTFFPQSENLFKDKKYLITTAQLQNNTDAS